MKNVNQASTSTKENIMKIHNCMTLLLAGASTIILAAPAFAQSAPAAETAASDGDIIVTAQRRDESLSKTPVAVAVLSSDTLAKAQIVSEQDLRSATPGLSVRSGFGSNNSNYALRGQSQDANSYTPPGVLPYINEVQVSGAGGSSAFYDLQSVQVLKGPQGTLFGRSATGGAILFTTAKPSDEFGGYVSALGGSLGAFKVEGAVTGAIVKDVASARIAGTYQKRQGYQFNLFTNSRVGDYERYGFRGSLALKLGAGITNDTVVDYLKNTGEGSVSVLSGLLPFAGGATAPFVPIEFLYAGVLTPTARATGIGTAQAFLAPAGATVQALAPAFYDAYFANPRHPKGGIRQVLADQQARGPYIVDSDAANSIDSNSIIITNTTSIEVGESAKIKNIFGYSYGKLALQLEADGTPYQISESDALGGKRTRATFTTGISDELQLVGTTFGDKLSYVVGLYFSDEKFEQLQGSTFFDLLLGPASQVNHFLLQNTTYAGYAQGTYKLNDSGLAATIGVRYTSEKVRKFTYADDTVAVRDLVCTAAFAATFDCNASKTFNRLSWQFGLQDQVSPNLLVYAVTRRAFKSGGYNGSLAPKRGGADVAGQEYKAERVTDVEIGLKLKGDIGGMPARLNIAGYHVWIKDRQTGGYGIVAGNPAALTTNVPNGKTYGAEIDLQFKPADWLSLGGSFNYTKASFSPDPVFVNGQSQIFDQSPDTPETSGTVYADVTAPLSGNVSGLLHGDVYFQSKTFNSPRSANNFGTVIDGYAITNFRVGLEDKTVGWSLTANLKNAFNRVYYTGGIPTGEIYQINVLTPAEPRTFTVEARFKF
jgi:iron complex outermembrane recepter protein